MGLKGRIMSELEFDFITRSIDFHAGKITNHLICGGISNIAVAITDHPP